MIRSACARRARQSATPASLSMRMARLTEKEALHYADRLRAVRRAMVRGTGVLRRSRGVERAAQRAWRPRMEIAAGEYGYTLDYFRQMLDRACCRRAAGRCEPLRRHHRISARRPRSATRIIVPLSAHCAPALHLHVACAAPRLVHQEWFHDHVRIEAMLFDGAPRAHDGAIAPDLRVPVGPRIERSGCAQYLRRVKEPR